MSPHWACATYRYCICFYYVQLCLDSLHMYKTDEHVCNRIILNSLFITVGTFKEHDVSSGTKATVCTVSTQVLHNPYQQRHLMSFHVFPCERTENQHHVGMLPDGSVEAQKESKRYACTIGHKRQASRKGIPSLARMFSE